MEIGRSTLIRKSFIPILFSGFKGNRKTTVSLNFTPLISFEYKVSVMSGKNCWISNLTESLNALPTLVTTTFRSNESTDKSICSGVNHVLISSKINSGFKCEFVLAAGSPCKAIPL